MSSTTNTDDLKTVRQVWAQDHPERDEPLFYVPVDGQQDGYTDVVAVDHSDDTAVKFTIDPDGAIMRYPLTGTHR